MQRDATVIEHPLIGSLLSRLRQAETGLSKLLTVAPDDLSALTLMATVQLDLGQYKQAREVIDQGLANAPQNSELLALKARALIAERRLRPLFLRESCSIREVTEDELTAVDPELKSFMGCNTPEEYEQALAALE